MMADVQSKTASSAPPVDSGVRYEDDAPRRDLSALLELTESLATRHDIHEILFLVVARLAALLGVDRGSIVLLSDDKEEGTVVATSDDEEIRNLTLKLDKYPEIRQVVSSRQPLIIDDVHESSLLREVLQTEGSLAFSSMALLPIIGEKGTSAVLILKGRSHVRFLPDNIQEARAVANATAIALNNAKILRALQTETLALRKEDERRLAELRRYFDFFESSADAMLVMDLDGKILFSNPTARSLTGLTSTSESQANFATLVGPRSRDLARTVIEGFRSGIYPVGVDFSVYGDEGGKTASVNFSGVLHERGAILASMRDVTLERDLARELAQTKDFLERVIDSSVDSIVSADLRGNVLLFNRAAVKLFGYRREEVVGKMSVEALYPEGVAREVMTNIKSHEYGGRGRLEDFRVDMVTKQGDRIPVSLSASLIIDGGHAVGSLGIFTDIREKLAMENQLRRAEQERKLHEKQAAIAELAGAAAHELNQPLTSVMGFAEYLKRAIGADPQLGRAISVIQSETDRMAEIVRKVGKITRYETKPYVGQARIFDLDRASQPDDERES